MLGLKTHRWNHIFREDDKTLIVAMDHPGAFGMMEGTEKPGQVIRQIRAGGADALLTTYGVVSQFAEEIGDLGIILRVDGGSTKLAADPSPSKLLYDVYDALRVGADAVGSMGMPGSMFENETLPYLASLVAQCAEWNVPVMAEMLPGGFENPAEMWTPENIGHACRIGAEMGVDFIKTTYSGDVDSFRSIVERIYVPIVVLGGGKSKNPRDLLSSIQEAIQAGASGVAVGRNIWRHPEPAKITAAIAAIIHQDATVDAALKYLD
ncbi:MAG: aldolase [Chloroflexi bacterium]|nr:aldolase [Chloroflexota bacterium]MBU1746522.1 aldolase [Chloroflexota bacterium]MBU1879428.1 aldolase [Chloroflexota bacterium]